MRRAERVRRVVESRAFVVLAVVALAHVAHLALTATTAAIVQGRPLILPAVSLAAAVIALLAAVHAHRVRRTPPGLAVALLFATFGLRYVTILVTEPGDGLPTPAVAAAEPSSTHRERDPRRPGVLYALNREGFRGPDWPRRARRPRVCLIGDSYVFGAGLEWEDTLGVLLEERLRARGREIETVNLGVPGHQLGSHLAIYEHARAHYECAVVVLALTLPNDLSPWDINEELRLSATLSSYSVISFLAGRPVSALLFNAHLPREMGDREQAFLRIGWERLAALREDDDPPMVVFPYSLSEPVTRLPTLPGVSVLPSPPRVPDEYIPGDGHPNRRGNRRFAETLADALIDDPELARRLEAPGP